MGGSKPSTDTPRSGSVPDAFPGAIPEGWADQRAFSGAFSSSRSDMFGAWPRGNKGVLVRPPVSPWPRGTRPFRMEARPKAHPPRGVGVECFSTHGRRPSAASPAGDGQPALAMGKARRASGEKGRANTKDPCGPGSSPLAGQANSPRGRGFVRLSGSMAEGLPAGWGAEARSRLHGRFAVQRICKPLSCLISPKYKNSA